MTVAKSKSTPRKTRLATVDASPKDLPRGRGRPAKPKTASSTIAASATPGKRGRPAGSTNAPKLAKVPTGNTRSGREVKPVVTLAEESTKPSTKTTASATGKKRGRPVTKTATSAPTPAPKDTPGRRGRPAKVAPSSAKAEAAQPSPAEPKRRGRPPKGSSPVKYTATVPKTAAAATGTGKKRGRPPKSAPAPAPESKARPAPSSGKRRGRPPKSDAEKAISKPKAVAPPTGKKRGRPAKNSSEVPAKKAKTDAATDGANDAADATNQTDADDERQSGEKRYWLMKAEPESRIETAPSGKKVDIKFSIDDLEAKTEPELWDGIRNFQARNNLRAMRTGDLAFLSESNTRIPGIVGVMEIVGPAVPDPAQFDEDSPYHDAKSSADDPRWDAVPVVLKRRFAQKVVAPGAGRDAAGLEALTIFKGGRLSVRAVPAAEWEQIMALVESREKDAASEADTDEVVRDTLGFLERIEGGIKSVFGSSKDADATPAENGGDEDAEADAGDDADEEADADEDAEAEAEADEDEDEDEDMGDA